MLETSDYILGIDLGTNSIGWATLRPETEAAPGGLIRCGVRIFEAGMDKLETGKAESRNAARRNARQLRRQGDRRARRRHKVFNLLQRSGLAPAGDPQLPKGELQEWMDLEPYSLRARALDEKLEPLEVGRALFHLAQRRGFLSNRKTTGKKKDEEDGKVKGEISHFETEMREQGARTWGEYLSKLDPQQQSLRRHYTHRSWFLHEFEEIWSAQAAHHPGLLTDDLKQTLHKFIFYQRPLKNQKFLIGRCELEPKRRRTAMASLEAQRARYLQDLNHLKYRDGAGQQYQLTSEQRAKLADELEYSAKLTFAGIKRALKGPLALPKDAVFNLEAGERKEIKGNTTSAKLLEVFGPRWKELSDADKHKAVADVLGTRSEETLYRIGRKRWGLDEAAARAFSTLQLEPDYSRHCRRALLNMLPHLEAGLSYEEAVAKAYPDRRTGQQAVDKLPPLRKFGEVRNPIVERSLTELRHLINTLVRQYGKPVLIRIELARDLKQSAKQREAGIRRMRDNEKRHAEAERIILDETGKVHPSRDERIKVLLWLECARQCPYTGKSIAIRELIGEQPQYDVEHIIPFSRSLDNSFNNLTLCEARENREHKKNKTPHEAYPDQDKFGAMLARIERMNNPEKLRRFKLELESGEDLTEDFCSQQLNDTRYASVLARDYLALLYGDTWRTRLQVNTGMATAWLRGVWRLNGILGDGPGKQRTDHRHHAIDAVVIGLISPTRVRQLAVASKLSYRPERFPGIQEPWDGFKSDVAESIDAILVSHRAANPVRGQLHLDSLYGRRSYRIEGQPGKSEERTVIRKPVGSLSDKEILKECIVDKAVRAAVMQAFEGAGSDIKQFQKLMADRANHPCLKRTNPDGTETVTPIHRVRVFQSAKPIEIGKGARRRWVDLKNNHHVEFFEGTDKRGNPVWVENVVTLLAAMRRKRDKQPIIAPQNDKGWPIVFSLAIGETVEFDRDGDRLTCVVQKLSSEYYNFKKLTDARRAIDVKAAKEEIRIQSLAKLKQSNMIKLYITPDGRIGNLSV